MWLNSCGWYWVLMNLHGYIMLYHVISWELWAGRKSANPSLRQGERIREKISGPKVMKCKGFRTKGQKEKNRRKGTKQKTRNRTRKTGKKGRRRNRKKGKSRVEETRSRKTRCSETRQRGRSKRKKHENKANESVRRWLGWGQMSKTPKYSNQDHDISSTPTHSRIAGLRSSTSSPTN